MTLRAVTTAQEEHSIHDVVENSVTKCDSFWKSKSEMKRDRAVKTGRWEWTKATETLSVSVTAFPLVEMAIKEFGSRSDSVTSTLDITVISGVGESAFVMTDKVESLTGVSFRKAGALVLVISDEAVCRPSDGSLHCRIDSDRSSLLQASAFAAGPRISGLDPLAIHR